MRRHPLRCVLLLMVVVAGAVAGPAAVTSAAAGPHQVSPHQVSAHVLTPPPACPSEDTCGSIPNDPVGCTGSTCATVEVGPTQNLGDDQFVYVNTYGFTPGSNLHINYCTDTEPLATAAPLCLTTGNALISNTDYVVQTLADGTESLSYQVLEVDSSDPPLTGQDPGDADIKGTFFCNAQTPCSVDVTDTSQNGGSFATLPDNTVVIPVTFSANTSPGCAATAAKVQTESEFGIEFVLPAAAADSCQDPNPSIAFNTAEDGLGAVTALAGGLTQVAFTDDPESPSQQEVLAKGDFKLIPIALTANVVAFRAQQFENQALFPLNTLDLTPNMVAGLVTGIYNTSQDADTVTCTHTLTCAVPPCTALSAKPKANNTCSLLDQVNYEAGFLPPQGYESFLRSDTAGSNGLLFSWLCNAPALPVTIPGGSQRSETGSAASVLENAFGTLGGGALTTCPIYDQLPPEALGAKVTYNAYNDPDEQSIKSFGYVQPGSGGSNILGGITTMNWAEARYYGLSIAALQNGAGQFVQPSTSSLQAAVLDNPTVNADGTITPNYTDKTDAGIYPMTSVVYAAVCAAPMPSAQASAESDMLSQLLNVTGGTDSGQLPDGFVPLPSSLVVQAQKDISTDVVGGGSSSACPMSSPVSSAHGNSGNGSAPQSSGLTSPNVTNFGGSNQSLSPGGTAAPTSVPGPKTLHFGSSGLNGGRNSNANGSKPGGPLDLFALASSSSRLLLPLALLLGLLAFLLGVFMLVFPAFRAQVLAFSMASGRWLQGVSRRTAGRVRGARSWMAHSTSGPKRLW